MSLETIISPEVINDELSAWLTTLAARADVHTILEVGSSDGRGSTTALVEGMRQNPNDPSLYCIEMSGTRFNALYERFGKVPSMYFSWGSAVGLSGYMTEPEVRKFYTEHSTNLNKYPIETVVGWLKHDIEAYHDCPGHHLIEAIKRERAINTFDLVFLDGSAFTGLAELKMVMGSKIIALDDTLDIKHKRSMEHLRASKDYNLFAANSDLRNGYAIWERKT